MWSLSVFRKDQWVETVSRIYVKTILNLIRAPTLLQEAWRNCWSSTKFANPQTEVLYVEALIALWKRSFQFAVFLIEIAVEMSSPITFCRLFFFSLFFLTNEEWHKYVYTVKEFLKISVLLCEFFIVTLFVASG